MSSVPVLFVAVTPEAKLDRFMASLSSKTVFGGLNQQAFISVTRQMLFSRKWRKNAMLKIENTEVLGWEHAIRGMRNPMNS